MNLTDLDEPLRDRYLDDLAVTYAYGPPYGPRLVTVGDLEELDLSYRGLRRLALDNLTAQVPSVQVHGHLPVLMVTFEGLESSLLMVREFWDQLAPRVPGELVVGVPARDVVMVTGTESPAGMERVERACERVWFAGGDNLLMGRPMIRRLETWKEV